MVAFATSTVQEIYVHVMRDFWCHCPQNSSLAPRKYGWAAVYPRVFNNGADMYDKVPEIREAMPLHDDTTTPLYCMNKRHDLLKLATIQWLLEMKGVMSES